MKNLIIDAHVHLPTYDGLCRLEEKKEQLLRDMEKDHVDRCILISDSWLESSIGSMEECIRLFAGYETVKVVGGISPLVEYDAQLERLKGYIVTGETVGIKLFPGHELFYLSDPGLQRVWKLAEEYDIPVLFHSGWDNSFYASPNEVRNVLEEHPKLKLVSCHCFYPDIQECLELTNLPGLRFDLSSVADQPEMTEKLLPYVKELIELVPERVLFGSDYAGCDRTRHFQMMDSLALSEENRRKVMFENALSLYFAEK